MICRCQRCDIILGEVVLPSEEEQTTASAMESQSANQTTSDSTMTLDDLKDVRLLLHNISILSNDQVLPLKSIDLSCEQVSGYNY